MVYIVIYYNLMELLSYMRYVVDRNVGMWRMTVHRLRNFQYRQRSDVVPFESRHENQPRFGLHYAEVFWGYDAVFTGDSLHWRQQATTTDVSEQPITPSSQLNQGTLLPIDMVLYPRRF